MSGLGAAVSAVVNVLNYRRAAQNTTAEPQDYGDRLAELVVKEVGSEIDLLGLAGSDYIEVDWTFNPRFSTAETRQKFIGDGHVPKATTPRGLSTLADDWRKHRPQLTVILGHKGAGKSTAAMLLTHQLLTGRTDREDAGPVPVLFRIGEWNPGHDLQAWIEDELVKHYDLPKTSGDRESDIAGRLLAGGHLVLVLDGFDEIAASRSQDALRALRQTLTTLPCPVVLTSRIEQFTEAMSAFGDRLGVTATVTLRPITQDKAELFLKSGHQDEGHWDAVIGQLRKDGSPIAQALTTPLMVFLCREAYKSEDDRPELDRLAQYKDRDAVEHDLISRFISSRYTRGTAAAKAQATASSRRSPGASDMAAISRKYDPADATRWLKFIAAHMDLLQTSQFEWWQLAETNPRRASEQVLLPVRLRLGRRGVVFGSVLGLMFGLMFGLTFGREIGPVAGLMAGPVVGSLTVLVYGLTTDTHTQSQLQTFTARQVLLGSRNTLIGLWLATGLMSGLMSGLMAGLEVGPVLGLVAGLVGVLMGVLMAGLAGALSREDWVRYRLTHFRLSRRESKLPRHLMDFLEDSHRLGVLRRVGAAYEFRHGALQRFLLDAPSISDEAPPSALKA